jgi:hypothetical protein
MRAILSHRADGGNRDAEIFRKPWNLTGARFQGANP